MRVRMTCLLGMMSMLTLFSPDGRSQVVIKQTADVNGQGIGGPLVSKNGAQLLRTPNGIMIAASMPIPAPGTYSYPPGNAYQPTVFMGSPEVFTGWVFFFNNPSQCLVPHACVPPPAGTPAPNDFTRASGGVYNFSGHIVAGGGRLTLLGHISVGQTQFGGPSTLQNPQGAEIHVAIAPHGTLQPALMPTQIMTPIGGPPHWWLSLFLDPAQS